jgi:hypothetical protein
MENPFRHERQAGFLEAIARRYYYDEVEMV